jgi:undecaprenyl diphosphate synthase
MDGIFLELLQATFGWQVHKAEAGFNPASPAALEVAFWRSRYAVVTLDSQIPRHIGIIMDGNGRWARDRGRPASFGHRAGVRAIKRVLDACEKLGVHVLSIYAFSTENWSRPRAEVRALMRLFHETMQREIDEMHRRGVRIVVSGRRDDLSPRMRERIEEAVKRTADNRNGVLNVCLNYGGRAEIVDAVKRIVADGLAADQVDEGSIASRLYNPDLPDPDLIIRTAGEHRVSNFLLWQSAYSEMLVTETLWPDFNVEDLKAALADYASRVRRFGGRPEKEMAATV